MSLSGTTPSLLDTTPPKPPLKIGRYILLGVMLVVIGVVSYFLLRNLPEEHAVSRFLTTLEQGNYQEAYQLWQPSSSYAYADFLHDWGASGDFGKIRTFKILGSQSRGASTVIVTVSINGVQPPSELLVDRKTKGLAYSPF